MPFIAMDILEYPWISIAIELLSKMINGTKYLLIVCKRPRVATVTMADAPICRIMSLQHGVMRLGCVSAKMWERQRASQMHR